MAENDNNTTTDVSQEEERQQQDNSRMAFARSPVPAPAPVRAPQQIHQQEQCGAKILQMLLGIAVQPKMQIETMKPESGVEQQQQSHMELSQIELIYRAEGNANLVLALPQFKKVLRLPKTSLPLPLPATSHSNSNSSSSSSKYNKIQIGNTQRQRDVEVVDIEWQQHQESQQQQQQSQQTQERQLQRQQKQLKRQEVVQSASDPAVNQNAKDLTMEDFVAYIEVIRNLLGSEYVCETEIVRIAKEEDIRWINEQIRAERPAHRRDKEFCGEFGLLLPDATRLPIAFDILLSNLQAKFIGNTFAIEIKPKQGWLLPPDVVNKLYFDLKSPMRTKAMVEATTTDVQRPEVEGDKSHAARCRFCAMQYLKLRTGKINKRTSYCPMALFSGVPAKMLAAIDALLQCPQNNLRIFRNGILIYDGEKHLYDHLIEHFFPGGQIQLLKDLMVACLLRDYTTNNSKKTSNSSKSNSRINDDNAADCGGTAKTVAGQPHLSATSERRKQMEKEEGVEVAGEVEQKVKESKIMPIYRAEDTHTAAAATARPATRGLTTMTRAVAPETYSQAQITEVEMLCLPKNCVLQKILHLQLLSKRNMPILQAAGHAHKSEKSYNALKGLLQRSQQQLTTDELEPSEAYLLGATALDCSIMLAFQEISMCNPEPHSQQQHLTKSPLSKYCVVMPRYGKTFLTKATLVDLDPKPDSHLCKYIKQTCQALDLFMDGGGS
ncbi:inositol-pentakisphosphate 2-kinase isoform X1 [Anastrepha obliqua]|uniref:inositol-pentakisphosphate 2-kinase isoform X1 n=2 Tax=Anastrepha obliqua TaxID=95512 RepID=UPI002409B82C|nr:inositol-pentakisphosphate 2-kinase isoform X1 [Anastrepha obliqua]XP_054739517.1 inositol-pentakisphosphate 2-kinase isoform X1 [Anastrepha obliqua]XP_054739518.1 inositol-pentakisphosphate 2-kinase isoform X1 [Anastrepha obliqua]